MDRREAKPFVKRQRRLVKLPHHQFQRRGAPGSPPPHSCVHQCASDTLPALLRGDDHAVDEHGAVWNKDLEGWRIEDLDGGEASDGPRDLRNLDRRRILGEQVIKIRLGQGAPASDRPEDAGCAAAWRACTSSEIDASAG